MSQPIRIRTRRATARCTPALFSAVSLAALLGCSDDVVNLGEGTGRQPTPLPTPPSYSRCVDSPTLAGDVIVNEQAQLDALEGCETIEGDVTVQPFFLPDLRPLHALKVVEGRLAFSEVPRDENVDRTIEEYDFVQSISERWLGSFEGLEALTSVGSLTIPGAAAPDLAPLSGLRELTGEGDLSLHLRNVRDLVPLSQLRGIRSLNLSGQRLESIADLRLPSALNRLSLQGETLTELESLRQVRQVLGELRLSLVGVRDLTSLANLEYVEGYMTVGAMPFLESLNGLEHLTMVRDQVLITLNPLLESMEGLSSLESTNVLWIDSNQRLRQIPDFPALWPTQALIINNNAALEQIAEFSGFLTNTTYYLPDGTPRRELIDIRQRPDTIDISRNPALRSFAIPAGWEGGKVVLISANESLETLALGELEAIDQLQIVYNPSLRNVDLGVLDTVDTLSVYENPLLSPATFDGLRTFERQLTGNAGQPPTTREDFAR